MKTLKVKLDLSKTDEEIQKTEQIKEICIVYENIGEGEPEWNESTPFEILNFQELATAYLKKLGFVNEDGTVATSYLEWTEAVKEFAKFLDKQ